MTRVGLTEPASPDVEGASRPVRLTEQLMLIAQRDARGLGARLIVLVIPERSQVLRLEEAPRSGLDAIAQQFVSWFDREAVLHVEALAALRAAQQRGEPPFSR
jgi:hypothetical protein